MEHVTRQPISYILLLLTSLLITGCSANSYWSSVGLGRNNALRDISIEAMPDANRNSAVAVDLLFIKDPSLIPLLTQLSAPEWFAQKTVFIMHYSQQIMLASFEVVPITAPFTLPLPEGYESAKYVLLFTNYIAKNGQHVAELKDYQRLKIRLDREHYQLLEMNKN
jgi:type VI secretion system protein